MLGSAASMFLGVHSLMMWCFRSSRGTASSKSDERVADKVRGSRPPWQSSYQCSALKLIVDNLGAGRPLFD